MDEQQVLQEPRPSRMPAEVAKGMVKAQAAAKAVEKDANNQFHRYKYASAEAVIAEAGRALIAGGLACLTDGWWVTRSSVYHVAKVQGQAKRGELDCDRLNVRYLLMHESGETWLSRLCTTPILPEPGRPADKAEAAALTNNLAYFLRGLLLLPRVEEGTDISARNDTDNGPPPEQKQKPPSRQEQTKAMADEAAAKKTKRDSAAKATAAKVAETARRAQAAGEKNKGKATQAQWDRLCLLATDGHVERKIGERLAERLQRAEVVTQGHAGAAIKACKDSHEQTTGKKYVDDRKPHDWGGNGVCQICFVDYKTWEPVGRAKGATNSVGEEPPPEPPAGKEDNVDTDNLPF